MDPVVTGTRALHIACSADAHYAQHCAAMLHSLLSLHPRGSIHVHFLHAPLLAPALRRRFERLVRRLHGDIRFHEIADARVQGLPTLPRIPVSMWYRIFLPELLTQQERVLYLDADTLVVDRLEPLWDTDFAGALVAAVTNVMDPQQRSWPGELGLAQLPDYFNSGVLLMNLAGMRAEGTAAKLEAFGLATGSRLRFPDQDALNVVLAGRRHALHPRWNCMNSLAFFPDSAEFFEPGWVGAALEHPAIVHFEGPAVVKPWHFLNDNPYRELYYRHVRAARWPSRLPEGITLRSIAKRFLPETAKRPLRKLERLFRP